MATQIGFISAIIGTATATSPDGSSRQLQAGNKVYQNELITTGSGSAIEIQFNDGSVMDLGRQSQAMLDTGVFDPAMPATAAAENVDDDVEAIQQALLEGEDPTIAGEATAAGPGAGVGDSEGGSSFVSRDYLNPEVIPTSGFDTIGVSNAFDEPENLNLIEVDEGEPLVPPTEITVSLSRELSPETDGVFENQGITYVATLSEASSGDITVTLSSGLQIFIPAGELTGFVNSQPQGDDVYIDPETVSEVISEISGGGENEVLSFDDSEIQTDIFDTIDTTTVTLNDVNVAEDGSITYSASVDHAPQGDLSITLSNGVVIVIPDGSTTGSSEPQPAQGDDVYVDGESFEVSIASTSGGNYEALDTSDTATVTISDTIDTTTVTLNDVNVAEDGSITYSASVDHAPQGDLSITLSNGVVIVIPDGSTTGSSEPQPAQGDDVYVDGESFEVSIAGTSGGNYEALDTSDTATVTISDTIDTTTVTLNDVNVAEDGSITYSASVDHAPQGDLSITLSNGVVIVIPDGSTTGSSDPQPAQGDDVYVDGESFEVSIAGTSGGNYEALDTSDTATVTISDTIDAVTATLSTSTSEISENGGDITYIINLTGGPGNIDPDTDLVFNLANGEQVTILAGQTSGSFTRTYTDGEITTQTSISNSIASVASGGDEYENLQTAGSTTVDVDYQPEINSLTPKAQGGDAIVDEDDLSADRGVGESAGTDGSESTTASGTFFINAPDGVGSLTIGGQAVITAGSFTAISFTTALGNTLSITGYDATTGEVSYEYTLEDNTETHGPANNGENSVFEDFAVVLKDTDGDEATDTLSVQIVDDVPEIAPLSFGSIEDGQTINDISLESVFGADGAGDIAFALSLDGASFLQDGQQVLFDGEPLTWSLNGDVLTAKTPSGVDAITLTLNDDDGNYDISVADGTFYLQGDVQTFAIGDLSGSNALAWVGQSDGIDTLIISEGTSTNTSNAGSIGYVGAGSQWIDAGTSDSTTFYFYDDIDATTGSLSNQTEIDNALANSVVAGVSSLSISVNTKGGAATTIDLFFTAVDGTQGTASFSIGSNNPSGPYLLEIDSSDVNWADGQSSLAIASVEFESADVDYRVGGDLVYTEITPTDVQLNLPVTITDGDGDVSDGHITGTITSEGVTDPITTPEIPDALYVGGNEDNTHTTGGGNDVLIGDVGGSEPKFTPGKNYSIALIADESGSMSGDRNELLKEALESFVNDLSTHDGVINIALIGFATNASLEISVSDLANNPDGLADLLAEIEALTATGGTNYEDAFDRAVEWFNNQPDGHEFISFFMTDGDPTYYNDGNGVGGTGNTTDYETLQAAVEAFAALSAISNVNGIGIGSGVNEDYLRFFDNTDNIGSGTETFGIDTVVLADFRGSNDPLDREFSFTDDSDPDGTGIYYDNSYLLIDDSRNNLAATSVVSSAFAIAVSGTVLAFDYRTFDSNTSDNFSWTLERQNADETWTVIVDGAPLARDANWPEVNSSPLDAGTYRITYSVQDNSPAGDSQLGIDNIELRVPEQVTGPVGEPKIIHTAGELTAELQSGSSTDELLLMGDDILTGSDGDDIIFGDTLYTGNIDDIDGEGYQGVIDYLTDQNGGTAPTDAQIMAFVRDNYQDLYNATPSAEEITAAGENIIEGGQGDDILIGGAGKDIFVFNMEEATGEDTIVNFQVGTDVLSFTDVMDDNGDSSNDIADVIESVSDDGTDITLELANGGKVTLEGVGNGGTDNIATLQSLLGNSNIETDQS